MHLWLVVQTALFSAALSQVVNLNDVSFSVLAPEVKNQLALYVQEDFANTNATVSALTDIYKPCTDLITDQLYEQCVDCISDKCQNKANVDCTQRSLPAPVVININKAVIACDISPGGCAIIEVGKKAVQVLRKVGNTIKNAVKKVTDGIKKIVGGIRLPRIRLPRIRLPRIRLPRIRLPRIRLPRIRLPRIRLPRIRLPRIRLPRIRLPRIRLPRIRLPRIRLPRIRLPRIRVPRIRFPRIRFRIFKRKRRQTREPTCEELANNPDEACQFFSTQCQGCAGLRDADELRLVERFCGVDFKAVYTNLQSQENRLARLEDIYDLSDPNVFNITRIQYDLSQYDVKVAGYHGVRVGYTLLGNPTTLVLKDPVNPLDPVKAIPVMMQLLYEVLVP